MPLSAWRIIRVYLLTAIGQKWPKWKKYYQLFLVALYACAFSFGENTLGGMGPISVLDTVTTILTMTCSGLDNRQ